MNVSSISTSQTSSVAKPSPALRAADGDYKTKGVGHEVKDADGDYKPTNTAKLASAASSSSNAVRAALMTLPKGGV